MPDTDIIRVSVQSLDKTRFLSDAFGFTFLLPLVANDDNVVVATYGPVGSGKTVFAERACAPFPDFQQIIPSRMEPQQIRFSPKIIDSDRLFRWRDFSTQSKNPINNWHSTENKDRLFPPRHLISVDMPPKAGVDFLEHPPLSHFNAAKVVILFGVESWNAYDINYYAASPTNGCFCPDTLEQLATNIKAKEIAQEMRKMKEAITIPTLPQSSTKEWPAPYRPPNAQRHVTFILTTENPEARKAFGKFRQELAQYNS
ncbi:MAG: hypothetical protein WCD70_07140 [Alphaproteobacteria bacterium]